MKKNDGGPAFPCDYVVYEAGEVGNSVPIKGAGEGMTLRDYFAAKAMQSYLAYVSSTQSSFSGSYHEAAVESYVIADAMIAARGDT